jgi:hypothetical protein
MKKRMTLIVVSLLIILSLLTVSISGVDVSGKSFAKKHISKEITGKLVTGEATEHMLGMNVSVTRLNNAPHIDYLDSEIFACENNFLQYFFNVTHQNEDPLSYLIAPSYPVAPFYLSFESQINLTNGKYKVFSGILNKNHAGGVNSGYKSYLENISLNDSEYLYSRLINITVLEVNNAPNMMQIGVQTAEVWNTGDNISFYNQILSNDLESGNNFFGNLTFNVTILNSTGNRVNLFNISSSGEINFNASGSQIGIYNVTVFVRDIGLLNPHPNISLCNENGGSKSANRSFSLTITDENRGPFFDSYYPLNISFNGSGSDRFYFNISKHDPDGTIPDSYWYVDNVSIAYYTGSFVDEFNYTFGCGVFGQHRVMAVITDGLFNASFEWVGDISNVECPTPSQGGSRGGGGSGGGVPEDNTCVSKWSCSEWEQCSNLEENYALNKIGIEERLFIRGKCYLFEWGNEFCGFQGRECQDLNNCSQEKQIIQVSPYNETREENKTIIVVEKAPENESVYEKEMPRPTEKLKEEGCISEYLCTEWNGCSLNYGFENVAENNISLSGEQYRDCKDIYGCNFDIREKRFCSVQKDIIAKEIGGYLEVYDKDQEILVSRLNSMPGELSIQITLDQSNYLPHCFDGIQNNGEEDIDCNYEEAKDCPVCLHETSSIKGDYILMLMTLVILMMSCFFLCGWYVELGKKIRSRKEKILRISSPSFISKHSEPSRVDLVFIIFVSMVVISLTYTNSDLAMTGKVVYGENDSVFNTFAPDILRECYYTENPDCKDSIKNCHDGGCEVNIDCGGPCVSCLETCSDNMQNQGETGIDCGGPCPGCYTTEIPTFSSKRPFWLISLIIIIFIIVLMIRLIYENKRIKENIMSVLRK